MIKKITHKDIALALLCAFIPFLLLAWMFNIFHAFRPESNFQLIQISLLGIFSAITMIILITGLFAIWRGTNTYRYRILLWSGIWVILSSAVLYWSLFIFSKDELFDRHIINGFILIFSSSVLTVLMAYYSVSKQCNVEQRDILFVQQTSIILFRAIAVFSSFCAAVGLLMVGLSLWASTGLLDIRLYIENNMFALMSIGAVLFGLSLLVTLRFDFSIKIWRILSGFIWGLSGISAIYLVLVLLSLILPNQFEGISVLNNVSSIWRLPISLLLWGMIFLNLQDTSGVIRASHRLGFITGIALLAISIWGVAVRILDAGLTELRISAICLLVWISLLYIGLGIKLYRPKTTVWPSIAAITVGFSLWLITPLFNPTKWTVESQWQRYLNGEWKGDNARYFFAHRGTWAKHILEQLPSTPEEQNETTLNTKENWITFWQNVHICPQEISHLPEALMSSAQDDYLIMDAMRNNAKVTAFIADLNNDDKSEVLLISHSKNNIEASYWGENEQNWQRYDSMFINANSYSEEASLKCDFKVVPPNVYNIIRIGNTRIER